MGNNVNDYIVERLREKKKVKIEIVGRKTKAGYIEMDWIIDKKFILRDFPFEVFEEEDGEEYIKLNNTKE